MQLLRFIFLQYRVGEMCKCAQATPLYPNHGSPVTSVQCNTSDPFLWLTQQNEPLRGTEGLWGCSRVGVLGYNFEMSPGTLSHTLIFPGAVAGLALCFFEPCGCCLLCCWPGGGSEQPGTAEKWDEGEQVAKQGRGDGESWNKCWKVVSVPMLVSDAGVVWGDGQDW